MISRFNLTKEQIENLAQSVFFCAGMIYLGMLQKFIYCYVIECTGKSIVVGKNQRILIKESVDLVLTQALRCLSEDNNNESESLTITIGTLECLNKKDHQCCITKMHRSPIEEIAS